MNEYHFEEIDSTSLYLKHNYSNYEDLTFISSDFQYKGHGRYNRSWISKKGENLLFSLLIKDKNLIEKYSSLSLSSAACIYDLLIELGLINVSIKWPNDVYVNDKKISGILLEGISLGSEMEALVIGIGLNVNSREFDIPATSIFLETKRVSSIDDIKNKLYSKIISMLGKIKNNDNSYLNVVKNHNYLKNKKVFLKENGESTLVEVIDIDGDNSLIVKKGNKLDKIYSGEIIFY